MSVDSQISNVGRLALISQQDRLFESDPEPVMASPRSLLKPLQVAALLRMSRSLTDEQVAMAVSSHNGEPTHLELIAELADATGVDLAAIPVQPHRPLIGELGIDTRCGSSAKAANPCAGKHILAAHCTRLAGADYLEFGGLVELTCRQYIREACRISRDLTPVRDGCGFPTYALTISEMATGLRSLLVSEERHDVAVVRSLAAHPYLVGGGGRAVTNEVLSGGALFAKDGVGGLFAVAYFDGAVAVGGVVRDDQVTLGSALQEARASARRLIA